MEEYPQVINKNKKTGYEHPVWSSLLVMVPEV